MFTIFSSYFNMMMSSSRYFFNLGAYYQNTLVAYNRIKEIMDKEEESIGTQKINFIKTVELKNISFSYNDKNVIENFSASFEKGKIYGIVGGNGAGKSTLINLILGLYIDEKRGEVLYNDININTIDMYYVRRNLTSVAEQETCLINDTIKYNLIFNNDEEPKHLNKYLDILNMKTFIKNLENGIDFIINEKNSNTSGGEKQKICILRALLKDSNLMIFDEPTSALDQDTTQKLIEYLTEVKKNKIIILITHDTNIVNMCDEVLYMTHT